MDDKGAELDMPADFREHLTPAMLHAAGLALCRHSFEGWEDTEDGTRKVLEAVVLAALAATGEGGIAIG